MKLKSILTALTITCCSLGSGAFASTIIDTDRLNEGQRMTYTFRLAGGEFARFAALADSDGLDLDMYVYAPDGRCLYKDELKDARPVVQFVAPYTGTYRITIKMHDTYGGRWSAYQLIRL